MTESKLIGVNKKLPFFKEKYGNPKGDAWDFITIQATIFNLLYAWIKSDVPS